MGVMREVSRAIIDGLTSAETPACKVDGTSRRWRAYCVIGFCFCSRSG